MHSFKFAVFLQNRNYNCKVLQGDIMILVHSWFQTHPWFLSHFYMGELEVIHMSRTLSLVHNTCCSHPL